MFEPVLAVFIVVVATLQSSARAVTSRSKYPLWDGALPVERRVESFLYPAETQNPDPGIEFMRDILEVIHSKQRVPKESCRNRRLLVLQMTSTSFEGSGSVLKQVMFALAAAVHSNRTLIWGLGMPFMFEHSRDVWAGPDRKHAVIENKILDCDSDQADPTGGAFGCFFQSLSSCSLEDISPSEMITFSHSPYNDSARVMMAEIRKGIACYHPPFGLFDYISSFRDLSPAIRKEFDEKEGHMWAASVAAYVFRIKPGLVQQFRALRDSIFNGDDEHGEEAHDQLTDPQLQSSPASSSRSSSFPSLNPNEELAVGGSSVTAGVWGMHVRHGDLKSLSDVYTYKDVFEFPDFFAAAREMTHALQYTPRKIFVATDSVQADRLEDLYQQFLSDSRKEKDTISTKARKHDDNVVARGRLGSNGELILDEDEEDYTDYDDEEEGEGQDSEDSYEYEDEYEEALGDEGESSGALLSEDFYYDDDEGDYEENEGEGEGRETGSSHPNLLHKNNQTNLPPSSSSPVLLSDPSWYGGVPPQQIVSVNNTLRYRTEHGSHTVAANGGCTKDPNYAERGMRCAMQYEDIVKYQGLEEHRSVPRSYRLMRVLMESVEDIYLLSQCSALISQSSSHFSTLGVLLIWARTGPANMPSGGGGAERMKKTGKQSAKSSGKSVGGILFLDQAAVESGITPTAFLHGMNILNGTHVNRHDPQVGIQRWQLHTDSFITGLPMHQEMDVLYTIPTGKTGKGARIVRDIDPWAPENRMRLVNLIPRVPEKIFYIEVKSWLGTSSISASSAKSSYRPTWPGHCPGTGITRHVLQTDPNLHVANIINLGVDHLDKSHPGQALQCWSDAMFLMDADPRGRAAYNDAYEAAAGNARTLRQQRYAEMVISENRNAMEFFEYDTKISTREEALGRDPALKFKNNALVGGSSSGGSSNGMASAGNEESEMWGQGAASSTGPTIIRGPPPKDAKGLLSLEDINDEIAKLEEKLKRMKSTRDIMLQYSQQIAAQTPRDLAHKNPNQPKNFRTDNF